MCIRDRQNLADCVEDESIRSDMRTAQALLEVPLVDLQFARALDIVNSARKSCNEGNESNLKQAALTIREVLVIKCCSPFCDLEPDDFENAMTAAFDSPLDEETMSMLGLTIATVIRLGKDKGLFTKKAPTIFGRHLLSEDTKRLFSAYGYIAQSSPGYKSRTKANGKTRRGKKIKKTDPMFLSLPKC